MNTVQFKMRSMWPGIYEHLNTDRNKYQVQTLLRLQAKQKQNRTREFLKNKQSKNSCLDQYDGDKKMFLEFC